MRGRARSRRAALASARRIALVAALAFTFAGATAYAEGPDNKAIARAAYDRGKRAYDAGRYGEAVHEFMQADELIPNPIAVRPALQAAINIDDPLRGMALVERAGEEGIGTEALVREARAKFSPRVGRITLVCPDGPCHGRIDGEPAKPVTWVTPGTHALEWDCGVRTTVIVAAGQSVEARPPAGCSPTPAPIPTTPPENSDASGGIAPTWFWVGIGLTTIGLGASIASGVDTLHLHQVFAAQPNAARQDDGRAAQLRTNVFFGVTAALAVATAGVGVFAVKWGNGEKTSTSVDLRTHGLGLAITLHR